MFNNLIGKNKELGRFLFCERYTLPPVKDAMYIAEGQELKRGAVVDVNGYLIGTAGLQPYAVLEFDCDTRDGGKEASVFLIGEFNYDKLTFADGLSKDDMDNIVYNARNVGIVIKPYSFSLGFVPQADDEPENFEKAKKYAKVGDAIYADSLGNVHVIEGKSVKASTIPEGWELVGSVWKREGTKANILYKTSNSSSKWINAWLFKVNGLKLDGTDTMVMQQGKTSGGTVIIGTFTASESATDLDTIVSELNEWLLDNPTAEGAVANYGWHAQKMKDENGNDSCFIVVDNTQNLTISNPINSSSSGASAEFYCWQFAGFTQDTQVCKRKDGVETYAVVWNKERFKAYNTNINSPTDSLTTKGLFNEGSFNATTIVKGYYGTYDNYLDNMMADEDSEDGVFGLYRDTGKECTEKLSAVKYTPINGSESPVFPATYFAANVKAHSTAIVEGLNVGDFYLPSINEQYDILKNMSLDGSDPVNSTLVRAGVSAFNIASIRWNPSRWNYYGVWRFENTGAFYAFSMFSVCHSMAIASYDVGE